MSEPSVVIRKYSGVQPSEVSQLIDDLKSELGDLTPRIVQMGDGTLKVEVRSTSRKRRVKDFDSVVSKKRDGN